jgi:hypothetical protein
MIKYQQLARQVGGLANNHRKNSMASSNVNDPVLAKGTTITFGSWVLIADGLGGFDTHLIDPNASKTSEASRRLAANDFVDHLDEIPLPVHIKRIRKQPDFDVTPPLGKSPSELVEDLDHLLETTRPGATVDWGPPRLRHLFGFNYKL